MSLPKSDGTATIEVEMSASLTQHLDDKHGDTEIFA